MLLTKIVIKTEINLFIGPITPVLKSLHWLTSYQRFQYKVITSLTKFSKTGHFSYLRSVHSLTPHSFTRFSSYHIHIPLNCPFVTFSSKFSNISFFFHFSPVLWNILTSHLRHSAHHFTPHCSRICCH